MGYVGITGAPPHAVVEVDGVLDAVRAHDLRRLVLRAVREGCRHVDLDLSRVVSVSDNAEAAVVWCVEHGAVAGATVLVTALSRPAARSRSLVALLVTDEER